MLKINKKGQGMVEYSLVLGFVTLAVMFSLGALGNGLVDFLTTALDRLASR